MIAIKLMAENSISIKNACIYSGIKERSYYYRNKKNNSKKHIKHRISDEIINIVMDL
jgi:hypothetical protein